MCKELHLLKLSFNIFTLKTLLTSLQWQRFYPKGRKKNHLLLLLYVPYSNILY